MAYWKDVWSNLVFKSGNAAMQAVGSASWRHKDAMSSGVKFVSQLAYKSFAVTTARQLAFSLLEGELNSLYSKYRRHIAQESLNKVRSQQINNKVEAIIVNGSEEKPGYGEIVCKKPNGGTYLYRAKTKYGTPVPEAMILSYQGDTAITIKDIKSLSNTLKISDKDSSFNKLWKLEHQAVNRTEDVYKEEVFDTTTIFHVDLAPKVSMSSTKNVVCTTVQGRDYTRKELVSGGDLKYSVSGNIVSNFDGVYPAEAVKRFVSIMQHPGIIDVNYFEFNLIGVKQVIITDFSLGAPTYKNMQPYSFSCVAVEPDEVIKLQGDTISTLNATLELSNWNQWYNVVLNSKLGEITTNAATSSALSLAGLIPGI